VAVGENVALFPIALFLAPSYNSFAVEHIAKVFLAMAGPGQTSLPNPHLDRAATICPSHTGSYL